MTDEALKAIGSTLSPQDKDILDKLALGKAGYSVEDPAWGVYAAALVSSVRIQSALSQHAEALVRSAEASEKHTATMAAAADASAKHSESLTRATWALLWVTVALAIIAIGNSVITIIGACIAADGC